MRPRFAPVELLHVELDLPTGMRPVGRLAWRRGRVLFEYAPSFVASGLPLSPVHLPVQQDVFVGPAEPFEGLFGLFNDSLPDGWGRLLLDRSLAKLRILPSALTPLDRLAHVGRRGPGALSYRPAHKHRGGQHRGQLDLDQLAGEVRAVVAGESGDILEHLLELAGSSAGARPKVQVACSKDKQRLVAGVDALPRGTTPWLVKFRAATDPPDAGAIEYAYSEMARAAAIDMAETHLFPAARGPGHFGTARFDRRGKARIHVHSACGLLHADHRLPTIGYERLLKATRALTGEQREVERMFRRMVFNVLAHNRDDHTKNHAFLMDASGRWRCSPAFDVTFSAGPGGEHALDVAGEGRSPGPRHLEAVAEAVGVGATWARGCIDEVAAAIARWPTFAAASGVSRASLRDIERHLKPARRPRGR